MAETYVKGQTYTQGEFIGERIADGVVVAVFVDGAGNETTEQIVTLADRLKEMQAGRDKQLALEGRAEASVNLSAPGEGEAEV